jgi:pyrroline-5-carboxylate reductase
MPDPKLQSAMAEIKAVLKKHDCAALVTLASPSHTEYLYEVAPSWSCAWLQPMPDGFAIRMRSKLKDYPSKEAQKKTVEATTGMFLAFANMAERQQKQMTQLIAMLGKSFEEISHWEKEE